MTHFAWWDGFGSLHPPGDLPLIRAVLRDLAPAQVVEFGTDRGGFAAFLASTVVEWDGLVLTVDRAPLPQRDVPWFDMAYWNMQRHIGDLLTPTEKTTTLITSWLEQPYTLLYTDNGNKRRELEDYVPRMHDLALVGVHEYGTALEPAWCDTYMKNLGFTPYAEAIFASAGSLTRFWLRDD